MGKASRDFQVFAKPGGAICNMTCSYCYYLSKEHIYPEGESFRMPDLILEEYIVQHIEASPERVIRFSWHGGEPTVLGLDYFRKIVAFQHKYRPPGRLIMNGIQTNGMLLDENWCRFFAKEGFCIGLSLDGPKAIHDRFRRDKGGYPTHDKVMQAYRLLRQHRVYTDILCVVTTHNVKAPLEIYRFFKKIGAGYVSFLPMVEREGGADDNLHPLTVPAEAWGNFLCTVFDEWITHDIGRIKIQIFEEAARTAFGQEHSLCIFRPVCGDIPVIEHNGDFYPCDHYVDPARRLGNIIETPLLRMLESSRMREFGHAKQDTLPRYCLECEVREMCHGECPKNRLISTPDGETGLNYLCVGYKRFFTHCQPFIEAVGREWDRKASVGKTSGKDPLDVRPSARTGQNNPSPCGSGLKTKKCCGP